MKITSVTIRDRAGRVLERRATPEPPPIPPLPATGLGDVVAKLADPIARALDKTLGTKLAGCGGCSKRRRALNRLVPDIRKPFG